MDEDSLKHDDVHDRECTVCKHIIRNECFCLMCHVLHYTWHRKYFAWIQRQVAIAQREQLWPNIRFCIWPEVYFYRISQNAFVMLRMQHSVSVSSISFEMTSKETAKILHSRLQTSDLILISWARNAAASRQ